uniref:Uncharacterized protein n=1 Tax=Arundo donax TaxID=35708 RepID=A0A0A9BD67_ARUDO
MSGSMSISTTSCTSFSVMLSVVDCPFSDVTLSFSGRFPFLFSSTPGSSWLDISVLGSSCRGGSCFSFSRNTSIPTSDSSSSTAEVSAPFMPYAE